MTDLEKLEALLNEFGVSYDTNKESSRTTITCIQGHSKVDGYGGFYVEFEFNQDGSFEQMGLWE